LESRHENELLSEEKIRVQRRVKPHTWQAFELTAEERLSVAQVAERLKMPVSEVYVAKSRVIKHLRDEVNLLGNEG